MTLSKLQVLKLAKPPIIRGVYFLIYAEKIVYVGSCQDVYSRIYLHKSNYKVRFSKSSYLVVGENEDLLSIEKTYIEKFTPMYNIQHNPEAKKEMDIAIILSNCKRKNMCWEKVTLIYSKHKMKLKHKKIGK